eukprot:TRINITY_DN4147_c0_g1_i9.p1 TRINITY_DN4147_c0_g1~~TRINITY_DN4147_c0_g1_i9.p1  ORF type:complete len:258 (-),score=-25.41 TRINITY_DN4147_c0_g1_i9:1167-1883(-)
MKVSSKLSHTKNPGQRQLSMLKLNITMKVSNKLSHKKSGIILSYSPTNQKYRKIIDHSYIQYTTSPLVKYTQSQLWYHDIELGLYYVKLIIIFQNVALKADSTGDTNVTPQQLIQLYTDNQLLQQYYNYRQNSFQIDQLFYCEENIYFENKISTLNYLTQKPIHHEMSRTIHIVKKQSKNELSTQRIKIALDEKLSTYKIKNGIIRETCENMMCKLCYFSRGKQISRCYQPQSCKNYH